jgi:hypothetical protein
MVLSIRDHTRNSSLHRRHNIPLHTNLYSQTLGLTEYLDLIKYMVYFVRILASKQTHLLHISSDHRDKGSPRLHTEVLAESKVLGKTKSKKTTKHCSENAHLCTVEHRDPITTVAGFFCGNVTASAAADPGIRIAFHMTFRTGTRISILDAFLRIPACTLIGPVAADFRARSYAAIC